MKRFTRWTNALCYLVSAVLICGYMVILWNGLHAEENVSFYYRGLYLDHTFYYANQGLYTVEPGTVRSFDPLAPEESSGLPLLSSGRWTTAEGQGAILTGSEGLIWVQRYTDGPMKVILTLHSADGEVPVTIGLDDVPVQQETVQAENRELELAVPAGENGAILQISFEVPEQQVNKLVLTEMKLC